MTRTKTIAPRMKARPTPLQGVTRLSNDDLYLFGEGTHYQLYNHLGSHPMTVEGVSGTYFAVWAPNAEAVFVEGDFNDWNQSSHPLHERDQSGVWEGFIPEVGRGAHYKYYIHSRYHGYRVEKADPYALFCEQPPKSASIVWELDYTWNDAEWMARRKGTCDLQAPMSVYELHLGSWAHSDEGLSFSYRDLAERLTEYIVRMGFTHVELMPVMEHPFYGSWGYQCTGYFAPTSRFGSPQDFMYLIDRLHQAGVGVILDWVPSHFTTDDYGLGYFDGTHLYEHADPRQGYHPDWGSNIFNYSRNEVRNFLVSSGLFWLEKYHIDGIRVDAVASMLYLDYSRQNGEWIPNQYGGNENIPAIGFLRDFNSEVYRRFPDVQTIAEESTAWPMVSRPAYVGGLGFGLKWDMGWMHDTLQYFKDDPIHRKYHHNYLTFRMLYAFNENFTMPLSHDEVVHGKGSLLGKMPGDEWQRFANLRLLFGNMYGNPGKKLVFMGGEFGVYSEWNHDKGLEWWVLQYPNHCGAQQWVRDLNMVYRQEPALHRNDARPEGFQWVDCDDVESSTLSYIRHTDRPEEGAVLAIFNYTPVVREQYRVGVPCGGWWRELLNSDAECYWGSGVGNGGGAQAVAEPYHGRPWSLTLKLPPLGVLFLKCDRLG